MNNHGNITNITQNGEKNETETKTALERNSYVVYLTDFIQYFIKLYLSASE